MSLYGTGRGEGITAVLLIGAIVVAVRVLGGWLADAPELATLAAGALLPAVGGMLCYRFLRAQGRSRYAGFLAGAGYGLSPWLSAIGTMPREQLAAALAPLALEAVCRCDRPSTRETWLPWTGLCLAAPFLGGFSLVGVLAALCGLAGMLRTVVCGDRDDDRPAARPMITTLAGGLVAAANLAWLAPLAPWLAVDAALTPHDVLTAHRPGHPGFDLAAVLRVPGPVVLTFVVLGVLRRQRHVDSGTWFGLGLLGALPTVFTTVPLLTSIAPSFATVPAMPATAWWLTLLACVVLGAAGLDDFLDLPLRRRTALPWLLALAVGGAPLLPTIGARMPDREWPLATTFLGLALLLPAWRRLGILRFKNWLATMALTALAIPLLQLGGPRPFVGPLPPPAVPAGETAPAGPAAHLLRPAWHYAGVLGALLVGGGLFLSAMRRRQNARPTPAPAKAAIVKKAKPSQRS